MFVCACMCCTGLCWGGSTVLPITLYFCNINIKKRIFISSSGLWDRESGEYAVCVDEGRTRGIDF